MSSQRFHGGLVALWVLLSCRIGLAIDQPSSSNSATAAPSGAVPTPGPAAAAPSTIDLEPQNPAAFSQPGMPTPAAMALPADTSTGPDASTHRKFYTLTASLRETYDDNINTSHSNPKSSLETALSPSVLVDFPDASGDFSARYTFGLTYYSTPPQAGNTASANGGTNNQGELQMSHSFLAQYTHAFSERFSLNLADSFQYSLEPNILQSTGTNYQNGPYSSNSFSANFTAQWSPLFSSASSFSDTFIHYDDSTVGNSQDSLENTGSTTLSYSVLPKISANLGGIIDDLTYQSSDRGYTTYTAFGGVTWELLPSLTVSGRAGASYVEPAESLTPGQSQASASIAPYGAFSLNWSLGARSSLGFDYAHEVTPSDQTGANGQESDRFDANFSYQITTRLSSYLTGVFTSSTYSGGLSSGSTPSESVYEVDAGLAYSYNSYLSFDSGVTASAVTSESSNLSYTRDEVYLGVRGTY